MTVTLRKRNQGKKTSLYLDFYEKGKRKSEYLRLYLIPNPKTKENRELNKQTLKLAESIKAKRQIEIQNNAYGFRDNEKMKGSVLSYFQLQADKRFDSKGNFGNWDGMIKYLEKFIPQDITFDKLNRQFAEDFKEYLDKKAFTKSNNQLSQNTKYSYFNKFRVAVKQAVKDGILIQNPCEGVESFKQGDTQREFLTLEELQSCAKAECEMPQLKKAFLVSCLTGLRFSDIKKLKWSEIQNSKELGYYIRYTQKKTKGSETLPISEQTFQLLGENPNNEEYVFRSLEYSAWQNVKLGQWMLRAGITRKITFHSARHTYATLQLTMGTDIYTVSKLLGHKELKTTQIYANVIDSKKKDAANKIILDL